MKARAVFSTLFIATFGLLLVKIWKTWSFSYFTLDDFDIFYWVQRVDGPSIFWYLINPASDFFRPVGVIFYWLLWNTVGLHPYLYHVIAWILHALNVTLLYILLSRIIGSRFAAAVGALLFVLRANFADIYWNFGDIYELLSCLLMFLALLVYCREKRSYMSVLAVLVLSVFAIKSKEMAITLPALLFVYDRTHKKPFDRMAVLAYTGLGLVALWFTYLRVSTMGSTSPQHPYYMDLTWLTLGRGYGWYWDHLYDIRLRWGAWVSISVILLLFMLYRRERRGIFFWAYVYIGLLPVVFLINHRSEFYWYVPFFGFAGLVGIATDTIARRVERWVPSAAAAIGVISFVAIAWYDYSLEIRKLTPLIYGQQLFSEEYRQFVVQLSALPPPAKGDTIHYRTFPKHVLADSLTYVTEVALRRTDVGVDVVEEFPPSCRYCLDFDDATLKLRIHP
jgi:hypothetical protein